MNKLFLKIFIAFWAAMTLISAIGIVLALTTDLDSEGHEQRQRRYRLNSQELIQAYEEAGLRSFRSKVAEQDKKWRNWRYLYKNGTGTVDGAALPEEIDALARLAAQTQVTQVHSGDTYIWVAYPATTEYTYVVKKIRPSKIERLLGLKDLGVRFGITFVVAGATCFLLARSLTRPIARLRKATKEFAGGELSTRVSASMSGRDEITALAAEFDQMAERIENLVKSQQRLVRDISHELRSPLTRLNIAVELVRQVEPAEVEGLIDRIERESSRLNDLIGHMLTLTLLENGVIHSETGMVDLQKLIADIVQDADFEARNSNRRVNFSSEEPVVIRASRELLRQAIENVVRNAIRCTSEESIVEVVLQRGSGGSATVTVRDFGPGVPETELDKLFLPFYRAEEARDRRSGGCGLGLTITERAVTLHGGNVRAANAPEGGLLVSINLPLPQPA